MIQISLGNNVYFAIDQFNEMWIQKEEAGQVTSSISLGEATEKRLDIILLHMGSLRVHTQRN